VRIQIQNHATDEYLPFTPQQWEVARRRLAGPSEVTFGSQPQDFRAVAGDIEVLLVAPPALRDLLPLEAPRLKIISLTWAGIEMLAPYDWLPPGVTLLNNSGVHAAKGSEYVLMALLMLANQLPALMDAQHEKRWARICGVTLAGRRLTMLGLGAIGGASASLAKRAGMRVTGVRSAAGTHPDCDRVIGTEDLDSVLPDSDYLVIALPLTPRTQNLLDRRRLSLLPTHAGVVNVGRGPVLDEQALCDLLDANRLAGAVLDVFHTEPVASDHRLWTTRNLIVTPHVSADDLQTYNALTLEIFVENLNAFAAGRPMPNAFDTARGTRVRT
jgi:glyoxylate/hydroxypyruvate reductase A